MDGVSDKFDDKLMDQGLWTLLSVEQDTYSASFEQEYCPRLTKFPGPLAGSDKQIHSFNATDTFTKPNYSIISQHIRRITERLRKAVESERTASNHWNQTRTHRTFGDSQVI